MKAIVKFWSLIVLVFLASCQTQEYSIVTDTIDYDIDNMVEIPIIFGGDINIVSDDISRGSSTDDLIGISIYKDGNNFSYGFFDHLDNLKVNLLKNSTYKIKATIIKNGKQLFGYPEWYNNYYPFYIFKKYNESFLSLSNRFFYTSSYSFNYLDQPSVGYNYSPISDYPSVDRLYGEIDNYVPEVNGTLSLDLKRVSFGLKVQVQGIEEGNLKITVKNDSKTFISINEANNGYDSGDQIWQFSSVTTPYSRSNNYYESVNVNVVHYHPSINLEEDLGSISVNIYRNKMNIIKINLASPMSSRSNISDVVTVEMLDIE